MPKLHDLPNIGPEIERQLAGVGITTPEELLAVGAREAWLRIAARDPSACINRLYGLEGAVQNLRWHHLAPAVKADLKAFYQANKPDALYSSAPK